MMNATSVPRGVVPIPSDTELDKQFTTPNDHTPDAGYSQSGAVQQVPSSTLGRDISPVKNAKADTALSNIEHSYTVGSTVASDDHAHHLQKYNKMELADSKSAKTVKSSRSSRRGKPQTPHTMTMALLPHLEKKPSCILTNVVSTCVNKASSHLELLQTLIEEWFVQSPDGLCAGHDAPHKDSSRRTTAQFRASASVSKKLSVTGMGMNSQEAVVKPKKTIADELPYLGGMEVVEEVFALISRLEMDRQQTETDLFNQKQRARLLQKRTDELAARRAREFPIAVQAEHDAAVEDLSELHWHVSYKQRSEEKLKDRVEHAQIFNNRLSEDINFVQKHCPLVEEKLNLEVQAMNKINDAQDETDKDLQQTLERLAKTRIRNEEAHTKAANERVSMADEIEDVRKELQDAVTELADSRMLASTYTHQIEETRLQTSDNVEEKKVLVVKCENAKVTEQMQNKKVDELTNKIRIIEAEHHRLEEDAFNKQEELTILTNTMESQFLELKKACDHEENTLQKMTQNIEDLNIEIDNLTRKIAKAETGILEDEKALRRMNSQIHNTEMMMNQMLDEYSKVQIVHSAIKDKLQEERERISQIEDALRQTLETLRKQCKDEIHTRSVLHSRIDSDGTELVKSQAEAKQKKEKLSNTVVEIEQQLKVVVEQVDKLREVYNAKKQILDGLEAELSETADAKAKVEKEYNDTRESLNPYLKQLKRTLNYKVLKVRQLKTENSGVMEVVELSYSISDVVDKALEKADSDESLDLKQQIAKLSNQMDLMARKKDEMDHTAKILSKSIKQNEAAVDHLKKELSEAKIQLESHQTLGNNLLGARDDVARRLDTRNKEHTTLMGERSVTIRRHTATLQSELNMNKGLAVTYRTLQGQYVDMKSKVMDMFDERNRLEAGIKDLKQLKGLQSRLSRALETYYKFRGMFNTGELERVQAENRISGVKVAKLQKNLNSAVGAITKFLSGQMSVLDNRDVVREYTALNSVKSTSITDVSAH